MEIRQNIYLLQYCSYKTSIHTSRYTSRAENPLRAVRPHANIIKFCITVPYCTKDRIVQLFAICNAL